jgi:hypothetical protein
MRLPFDALAEYVGPVLGLTRKHACVHPTSLYGSIGARRQHEIAYSPARAVAVALNISTRTAQRWERDGLSLDQAERVATLLGVTPWDIWFSAYAEAVEI